MDATDQSAQESGEGAPGRWWVLATVICADIVFGTTTTVLSAALSTVAEELGTSEAVLAWAVTGPFLALAIGNPFFGKLGDLYGLRRVFRAGLVVFTFGTLACALATSAAMLITLRVIASIGAAASLPTGLAMILRAFSVEDRPRALGWFHSAITAAPAVGLVLGGLLIEVLGWQALFWVLGGVGLVALVGAFTVIDAVPGRPGVPLDVGGAALLTTAAVAALAAASSLRSSATALVIVIVGIAVALIAGRLFVLRERRIEHPLIDLRYFEKADFRSPTFGGLVMNGAYLGGLVITPLVLQDVLGYSLAVASALLLLRPASFSLGAPFGGQLVQARGVRTTATIGTSLMIVGSLLIGLGSATEWLALVLLGLPVVGLSFGLTMPAFATAVAGAVDDADLGVANGVVSTAATFGGVLGAQVGIGLIGDLDVASGLNFAAPYALFAACGAVGLWQVRRLGAGRSAPAEHAIGEPGT